MVINVSEIVDYIEMAKLEVETRQALNNYERLKALVKAAREHIKDMRYKFDEQREKCPLYLVDSKLTEELAKVKTWTPNGK